MPAKTTAQELAKLFILLQTDSALMEREYLGLKKEGYSHYTSLSIQTYLAEIFSNNTAEKQQSMPWLVKNEEHNVLGINWSYISNSLAARLADIAQSISTDEDSALQGAQHEQSSERIISQAYKLLIRFYSQKSITDLYQFLAQCANFNPTDEYVEYYKNDIAYQYLDMLLLDIFEPPEDAPIVILKEEEQHHSPTNDNQDFYQSMHVVATNHMDLAHQVVNECIEQITVQALVTATVNGDVAQLKAFDTINTRLLDQTDEQGRTISHHAVRANQLTALKFINKTIPEQICQADKTGTMPLDYLKQNADSEFKIYVQHLTNYRLNAQSSGINSIHEAARTGNVTFLHSIYELEPALFDETDDQGWNALHIAAQNKQHDVLDYLIGIAPLLLSEGDYSYYNPIYYTVCAGDLEGLNYFVTHHPMLLNKCNENQYSLFHHAARHGQLGCLRILFKLNPQLLNLCDNFGNTALTYAKYYHHDDCQQYLQQLNEYQVMSPLGVTVMHEAAYNGDIPALQNAYASEPSLLQSADIYQSTPLYYAALASKLEVIQFFYDKDQTLFDCKNPKGMTIAHVIASQDNIEILKFLKDNTTLFKERDCSGQLPIHYSVLNGAVNSFKYFINLKDTNITKTDFFNRSHAHLATRRGHQSILNELPIEVLRMKDNDGRNALHYACIYRIDSIAQYLKQREPSLSRAVDNAGHIPEYYSKLIEPAQQQLAAQLNDEKPFALDYEQGKSKRRVRFNDKNNFALIEKNPIPCIQKSQKLQTNNKSIAFFTPKLEKPPLLAARGILRKPKTETIAQSQQIKEERQNKRARTPEVVQKPLSPGFPSP